MKKIHRFLTSTIPATESFPITDERVVHQIRDVLELKPTEEIILFTDGGDDEVVTIETLDKTMLSVKKSRTINVRTNSDCWLVADFVKRGKFRRARSNGATSISKWG